MSRGALLLILVGAGFVAGVLYMLNVEFDAGDVYPEFSTLRTDPRGARLLFDSLVRVPGVTAVRNYAPLETLEDARSSIVILALPSTFGADPGELKMYERLAERGNRLIAAFGPLEGKILPPFLTERWRVRLASDSDLQRRRRQYFREAQGWQPLERTGDKVLAIERRFGQGAIVLVSASEDFTNESSVRMDRLAAVSGVLGEPKRIVFDEAHLGIAESGSVVGLARRFRLSGMAFGLALCAALFIWRSAVAFPPPAPAQSAGAFSGRTSRAGLLTLVHRHIPRSELLTICWKEWLTANRRAVPQARIDRASAIAAGRVADPIEAVREIQDILRGR